MQGLSKPCLFKILVPSSIRSWDLGDESSSKILAMYAHRTTWSSSTHVNTRRHWSALNPVAAEAEINRIGVLAATLGNDKFQAQ